MSQARPPVPLHLPLDRDDFLRRACGACGREYKRKVFRNQLPVPDGGYACPYCGERAPEEQRFTADQLAYANEVGVQHRLPELQERERAAYDGPADAFVSALPPAAAVPALKEPDDMVIWVLGCHDEQPLKVADDWNGTVGCLICGQRT